MLKPVEECENVDQVRLREELTDVSAFMPARSLRASIRYLTHPLQIIF